MADNDKKYTQELRAEKDTIDPSFVHAVRLITEEIDKVNNKAKDLKDVSPGKTVKVECDIRVPTESFPKINFVGRLIGPGGATMKGIQELTNTRVAVLGKGSVRDEQRARESGKDHFLDLPLHVHISAVAPLPQAYMNLASACLEIQKLLQGDEDTDAQFAAAQGLLSRRGRGRGSMGGSHGMGRSGGRGAGHRGRGAFQRGGVGGRGSGSSARGSSRGMRGGGRGAMRGAGRGQHSQYGMKTAVIDYAEDYSYDSFAGASASGYDAAGYSEYDDSFDASYDPSYGSADAAAAAYGADAGYGDMYDNYQESYGYGNGTTQTKTASFGTGGGQGSFRGKMGGRGGMRGGRQKPY